MTESKEVASLKEEVRILKQFVELAQIVVDSATITRMHDQELICVIKEYKEFLYRKAHE